MYGFRGRPGLRVHEVSREVRIKLEALGVACKPVQRLEEAARDNALAITFLGHQVTVRTVAPMGYSVFSVGMMYFAHKLHLAV